MDLASNASLICKQVWISDKHCFFFEFSSDVTKSNKYSDMVCVQIDPDIRLPYKITEDKYLDIGEGERKYEIVSISSKRF